MPCRSATRTIVTRPASEVSTWTTGFSGYAACARAASASRGRRAAQPLTSCSSLSMTGSTSVRKAIEAPVMARKTSMSPTVRPVQRWTTRMEFRSAVFTRISWIPPMTAGLRETEIRFRYRTTMRTVILPLVLLAAALAAPAQAAVTVTIVGDPDRYADAGDRNSDPRKVVQDLARFLTSAGDRYLPAGANLTIEILDLDRAGRPRMDLPAEIRIVTGKADAPCMELRYSLETAGRVVKAAKERVCDLD